MDYFTLFSFPISYFIDDTLLVSRYRQLQQKFHPDRFVTAEDSERLTALQQAAMINEAYQTLKHPLKRAEYLLFLQGIDLMNTQQIMDDVVFLTEQLRLREELDQIELNLHDGSELLVFTKGVAKIRAQFTVELTTKLNSNQWRESAEAIKKLRFLDNLQQRIELIEQHLFDE